MALKVVSLSDLLRIELPQEHLDKILSSFVTLKNEETSGADDVEYFLHNKAANFEKMDLSRTYLVMSDYQGDSFLAGYFAISNRSLAISNKNFSKFSQTLKRRLMGVGHKTEQKTYEIKGFLIGQLGKNYSEVAKKAKALSGDDLLELAYRKVLEAYRLVGGRIVYLECEHNDKVKEFYNRNGFRELLEYDSPNNMCLMVKKLDHIKRTSPAIQLPEELPITI